MKRPALTALLLMLSTLAFAQAPSPKAIQAAHNRQVAAFNKKDLTGFMAHYSPELKVTPAHGDPMDFAAWKGFIQSILPGVRHVLRHDHKVIKCTAQGATLTVTIDEHEAYDIKDGAALFGKKDAPHRLTSHATYEETWTKTKTGWKVREVKMLSEEQTLDDHPFPNEGRVSGGGAGGEVLAG